MNQIGMYADGKRNVLIPTLDGKPVTPAQAEMIATAINIVSQHTPHILREYLAAMISKGLEAK
jgi:hypothetical protein